MKTISLDLRERIVAAYDGEEGTREEVAKRFRVSVGMVKKLLQQRRKTGELGDRHRYSGRDQGAAEHDVQRARAALRPGCDGTDL